MFRDVGGRAEMLAERQAFSRRSGDPAVAAKAAGAGAVGLGAGVK